MGWNATEMLTHFEGENWNEQGSGRGSAAFYVPQQVQTEAKMFSYLVKQYNNDTLHELNMYNAGEMF